MTTHPEPQTAAEVITVDLADLQDGDVVVQAHLGGGDLSWQVRVRREVSVQPDPIEGTIANFYGQRHVLLKRGRTLIAHAQRHSGDPLVPGVGKDAELNNKFIWVSIDGGWSFREYNSTIDTQTPEIVYVPGETIPVLPTLHEIDEALRGGSDSYVLVVDSLDAARRVWSLLKERS